MAAAFDLDQPMSEDRRLSVLFQRFNGLMLGFFSQMSTFRAVREQWPVLQIQMSHFASEINLNVEIPTDVEDFANRRGEIASAILHLGDRLSAFKVAFGLGYSFGGISSSVEIMSRSSLDAGMSALGLDPVLLDELIATSRMARRDGRVSMT